MKLLWLWFCLFIFTPTGFCQQNPKVITTKNTNTIIPEGIAVHSNATIYVTSIAQKKIIEIKQDGSHRDFIQAGDFNFGMGVGIKLDEKRNRLWVVSDKKEGDSSLAQVHVFNLSNAKLIKTLSVKDTTNHFFNDLAIDDAGNASTNATYSGELFFVDEKLRALKLVSNDTLIKFPNGIAFLNGKLYIATYGSGLLLYDVKSKMLSQVNGYANKTYAYSFDGLGFYNKKLYGVYNGAENNNENAVIEYALSSDGNAIVSEKIFAGGHSSFFEPTTLSISKDKLYLLANSHLGYYNANKESVSGIEDKLTPVTVLVYDLK